MPLPAHMKLLVLGQGTTGLAVARWAVAHREDLVDEITLYGGASSAPTDETRSLEEAGVICVYGSEEVTGSYDVCVASPGISEFSAFFASARAASAEIMGEPEFAYRLSPDRWIAVTGTNGKTTTTTLIDHLLRAAGLASVLVGNIGPTAISHVDDRPVGSWFAAELSSYQIATTQELHPRVAVLLNITPDHLGWHRTHEAYAAAKCRLFRQLGADDLAIIDVDDPGVRSQRAQIEQASRRVLLLSLADAGVPDAAFVRDGMLVVRLAGAEHELVRADELAIAGRHNVVNALAAAAAALFAGADDASVRTGLRSFQPLEHRIEPVGEVAGARYYNDSKATNTDAVEKALDAFAGERVILLVGGHDKGTPLEAFAEVVMSSVGAVVCFGEARGRLMSAMEGASVGHGVDIAEAENLADAVTVARSLAGRGDVVLLSPACSSFDEFSGFEERGRAFKALVRALQDADGR